MKNDIEKENIFGLGNSNDAYKEYFIGQSYLNMLAKVDDINLSLCNVTFEPGYRNNWHIHHATKDSIGA